MMNMVSKSSSILMAIGIVAVAAVAIIGLGYAYTASTDNEGNTSVAKYITLNQGNVQGVSYTGAFDNAIKFDTVTGSSGTTYSLNQDQFVTIIDNDGLTPDVKAASLGSLTINVTKTTNNEDNFKFSVQKIGNGTMSGTFYISIAVNGSNAVVRQFDAANENFYQSISNDDHTAATTKNSATNVAAGTTTTIVVTMYVSAMDNVTNPDNAKPLNDVTFRFKADVPEPQA